MMKNVFMLVNYTPSDDSIGITKKIKAQIKAMRELGYAVSYTAYSNGGVIVYGKHDEVLIEKKYLSNNQKVISVTRYSTLLRAARDFINQSQEKYDYLYGRISAPTRLYLDVLQKFKSSGAKIIIESLSYFPGMKPKAIKSKYIAFFLNKNKKQLARLVDKLITEGEVPEFFGIPTQKGKIGVDVDSLPIHHYVGDPEELNMITVATEREYHGYDRLIKSFIHYREKEGKANIKLHLVGELYDSTVQLINNCKYKDEILMYGRVSGKPLIDIYNCCNIGIGPLGQHRVGGKKDTGLKTKEYFGMGIPYFYSGVEEDLPEDYPYVFRVPSDESLLNFDEIYNFYNTIKDDSKIAIAMRNTAQQVFSWKSIMKDALET